MMLEGYHQYECGVPDIYGTILDKVTALSQGKITSGDTKDYSRLALRVKLDISRWGPAWSTLIGRGVSRLSSHWSRVLLAPVLP